MSAPNVKVVFKACLLCCTKGALLNHRCTRSPFPAGECKGFVTNSFAIQRTSF